MRNEKVFTYEGEQSIFNTFYIRNIFKGSREQLKEDKRRFRISLDKNIFNENESIILDAEVYNDNYELINDGDVSLIIKDSEGKEFPSVFNRTARAYSLNAGVFPV